MMATRSKDHNGVAGRRKPLLIDAHIGNSLKTRRVLAGITQSELGNALGITFQQVQKYEKGVNRISAGHLYLFAQVLNCKPGDFFDGLQKNGELPHDSEILLTDETMQLFKAFGALDDRARNAVVELARSLAAGSKLEALSRARPSRSK